MARDELPDLVLSFTAEGTLRPIHRYLLVRTGRIVLTRIKIVTRSKGDDGKWITAGELAEQLERDPQYRARMAEVARRRQAIVDRNIQDARPLLAQLAAQGFEIRMPADLFNRRLNYRAAIPTLLEWLPRISNPDVKTDVAMALSVKWAKPAAIPVLVKEFERAEDDLLRWAIANALEVVADDSAFSAIAAWATDSRYGDARQMLVLALGHMTDPAAFDVLVRLLNDETVAGHAVIAMGNLRDPRAKSAVEPFLTDQKKWIRDAARKAIKKIDAAGEVS